jgi:DNA polymerase elongation subunit (family B)
MYTLPHFAEPDADFQALPPLGDVADGFLTFALHTVDVRTGYAVRYPLGAATDDAALAVIDDRAAAAADAAARRSAAAHHRSGGAQADPEDECEVVRAAGSYVPPPPRDVPPCFAYLTGHTRTGAKVGFVVPWRPRFQVEGPPTDVAPADVQRGLEEVNKAVADVGRSLRVKLLVAWHTACRFKGYVPTPGNAGKRREFWYAEVSAPNHKEAGDAAWRLKRKGYDGRVHEDGIDADQLFVDAHGLTPCGWHRVPLRLLTAVGDHERQLLVHYEYDVTLRSPAEPSWWSPGEGKPWGRPFRPVPGVGAPPSLVLACIDAEMTSGSPGRFPYAARPEDKVVVVSVVFAYAGGSAPGRPAGAVFERVAFVLADPAQVAPIPGVRLRFFNNEKDLVVAVRDALFVDKKVDVLAGHNIVTFDVRYLAARAWDTRFMRFSALLRDVLQPKVKRLTSSGMGSNNLEYLPGAGFVHMDSFLLCKVHPDRLRENTLKAAAAHFLPSGATKHDMPYEEIPRIVGSGTPVEWAALVGYCVQDSVLVWQLLKRWGAVEDMVAQSVVITIPWADNALCGQQQRVRDSLMRMARSMVPPMVMNGVNVRRGGGAGGAGGGSAAGKNGEPIIADGGKVLDTVRGLHTSPVVVLDFASLYPSVQQSLCLCWSTEVTQAVFDSLTPAERDTLGIATYVTATGTFHIAANVPSVFPRQLRELLAARNRAKADMRAAAGAKKEAANALAALQAQGLPADDNRVVTARAAVEAAAAAYTNADARQKATKVVMNSGYGTSNVSEAKGGVMPCRAVGTITCKKGADLNERARKFVESHYGAVCVYGDTDSIFVKFPLPPGVPLDDQLAQVQHAFNMGMRAERELNAMFDAEEEARNAAKAAATGLPQEPLLHIVHTECEKVYSTALLRDKKVYAGIEITESPPDTAPRDLRGVGKVATKGLRAVRRDAAGFVRSLTADLLEALLRQRSEEAFWRVVHQAVVKVCLGPAEAGGGPDAWSLSHFCFTRELKEGYERQERVQEHVAVTYAKEWAKPRSGYTVGDRVPYVIVAEADPRRLTRPPWLASSALGGSRPAAAADHDAAWGSDADSDSGGEDNDSSAMPDHGSAVPLALGGAGRGQDKVAAHARAVQEVLENPEENTIDVRYYTDQVCSVVKQLQPDTADVVAECARLRKFAAGVHSALTTARGASTRALQHWQRLGVDTSVSRARVGERMAVDIPALVARQPPLLWVPPSRRAPPTLQRFLTLAATGAPAGAPATVPQGAPCSQMFAPAGATSSSVVHKKTAAEKRQEKAAKAMQAKRQAQLMEQFVADQKDRAAKKQRVDGGTKE